MCDASVASSTSSSSRLNAARSAGSTVSISDNSLPPSPDGLLATPGSGGLEQLEGARPVAADRLDRERRDRDQVSEQGGRLRAEPLHGRVPAQHGNHGARQRE